MGAVRTASQPHYGATGVSIPIGRAETDKGGNKINASGICHRCGNSLAFAGSSQQPQFIAKPLNRCAGDEDASLESVIYAPFDSPGDRRKQVWRADSQRSRVKQHEAPCTIGVFRLPGPKAGLAE